MRLGKVLAGIATGAGYTLLSATPVFAQSYDYYTYSAASDAAASGIFGFSMLLSCCIPLFMMVIAGVLAYVVYKDAKKNNVENPALWAILTFFFSLLGLLVYYLAIRPEAIKKMQGVQPSQPVATPAPVEEKKD